MAKRNRIGNINTIRALFVKATNPQNAESTRKRARAELYRIAESQRKIANSRLKALRAADMAYGNAYDNAKSYISSHYGDAAKTFYKIKQDAAHINEIYEQALAVNAFASSDESKVKHQRLIERKRFETFRTRESFGGLFSDWSDKELREFLRYLGNENIGDYLSFYDESGDQLEMVAEAWRDDTAREKLTDLLAQYNEYREQEEKAKQAGEHFEASSATGLSHSEFDKELMKLYASIAKRRR